MTYGKSVFAEERFGLEADELYDDVCAHEFRMVPEKKGEPAVAGSPKLTTGW
jgi:hypothetical protein